MKWWQRAVFYQIYPLEGTPFLYNGAEREDMALALDWLALAPFEILIAELV